MPLPTLLDIAIQNVADAGRELIDEAVRAVPEVTGRHRIGTQEITIPNTALAETIPGTEYKTLIRTSLPTATFRNANEGSTPSKSGYENRQVETFILNPRWECDVAVAQRHVRGEAEYIREEGVAIVEAAFKTLGRQFFYGRGTNGDAKGHPGLIDSVNSALVVDATGSTSNTGSSVWAVKWGPRDVTWVMGQGGSLSLSELRKGDIVDSNNRRMTAYIQELLCYPGVQVGSIYSCARLKNLTEQTGKTLTDALLARLFSTFPEGWYPDALYMSQRSGYQLQTSRTSAMQMNVKGSTAPWPTDYQGVPIVYTSSILNTEAIS